MRILLAEDDTLLGDGLRAGLRQRGFQIDWVRDGAAAERELRGQPYAAAVLDLGLPLRDGIDVLGAVRRAHGQVQERLVAQDVVLDPAARSVTQTGVAVTLSTREFDLLQVLMLGAGRVLSREQIEQQLYSWGQEVESNAVEVHVHHLRRKLGAALIQTVRGVGYMLVRDLPGT